MKKYLFLLLSTCFLFACGGSSDEPSPNPEPVKPAEKAPVTIMTYLFANNNLSSVLEANIGTMYDGLAKMKKSATLLVYMDGKVKFGTNQADHVILKYETDGHGNINGMEALDKSYSLDDILSVGKIVKEYSTQNSADKGVMTKVLKDMISASSSEKLGLVVGSHGSAWLKDIATSRAIGPDGSNANSITVADMADAMEATGKTFDFLLFDACYMATGEVCYEFKDVTNYQIASVLEIPGYGFPYDMLMNDLYKGTVDGYKKTCDYFVQHYQQIYNADDASNRSDYVWATISLVDSKEMQALTDEFKQQIIAHKDALANFDIKGIQEYGRKPAQNLSLDMRQFVKVLNNGTVPASFDAQMNKAILHKNCMEKGYYGSYNYDIDKQNYCGLGVYVPLDGYDKWNSHFKTIDWFTAAGWNEVTFSWDF